MAYGKRRSYRRRAGRRGHRTLSTRSIFNNKGARAQASQISALKKRINYVYRQCRPEVKIKESTPIQLSVDRQAEIPYLLYKVNMPPPGYNDQSMVGNVCNIKDVKVSINCELEENFTTNNYVVAGHLPITCEYRIIGCALKSSSDANLNPDDIGVFSRYGVDPFYYLNASRPLNEGVTSYVDILYDRRFILSNMNYRSKVHNLKIHGGRIKKYVESEYMNNGKASIWILIVPVLQYSTRIDNAEASPADPTFVCRIMDKIAYTDP